MCDMQTGPSAKWTLNEGRATVGPRKSTWKNWSIRAENLNLHSWQWGFCQCLHFFLINWCVTSNKSPFLPLCMVLESPPLSPHLPHSFFGSWHGEPLLVLRCQLECHFLRGLTALPKEAPSNSFICNFFSSEFYWAHCSFTCSCEK